MPEYVLAVDKPHLSVDGLGVIYKRTQVEREFENDNDAISWGRFAARDDLSFPLAGIPHLARPITLWRVTPQEVVVLWGDAQITSPKPKRVTLDQMPVDTPADFARLLRWMAEDQRYRPIQDEMIRISRKMDELPVSLPFTRANSQYPGLVVRAASEGGKGNR